MADSWEPETEQFETMQDILVYFKKYERKAQNLTVEELLSQWRKQLFTEFELRRMENPGFYLRTAFYEIHHNGSSFRRAVAFSSFDMVNGNPSVKAVAAQVFMQEVEAYKAEVSCTPFSIPTTPVGQKISRGGQWITVRYLDTGGSYSFCANNEYSHDDLARILRLFGHDTRLLSTAQLIALAEQIPEGIVRTF